MVKREHVLEVLRAINENKLIIPRSRKVKRYNLYYEEKSYPPKFVLSMATKIATGRELNYKEFNGGYNTNKPLHDLGFVIRQGNDVISFS